MGKINRRIRFEKDLKNKSSKAIDNETHYESKNMILEESENETSENVALEDEQIELNTSTNQIEVKSQRLDNFYTNFSRGAQNNILGVFGKFSDDVVNNFILKLSHGSYVLCEAYVGDNITMYDVILARILNFVEANRYNYGISDYELREIYSKLEDAKKTISYHDDEYSTPLESMMYISLKSDVYINIIDLLRTLERHIRRNIIFIIDMDMESFNYKNLKELSKLKTNNTFFILRSIFNFDILSNIFSRGLAGDSSIIYKFLDNSQIIRA